MSLFIAISATFIDLILIIDIDRILSLSLTEEQKLNKKFQEELNSLQMNKDKVSLEFKY